MRDAVSDASPSITRAQEVQERIVNLIIGADLRAGDPIPTETQLIASTGASRTAVREALKALDAVGIIDIRRGHGTFVTNTELTGLRTQLTFESLRGTNDDYKSLRDIVNLRETLEVALVEQLCSLPEVDLTEACAALEIMEQEAASGMITLGCDRDYHLHLYTSLNSSLIGPLLGAFFDAYHSVHLPQPDNESLVEIVALHRQIITAIHNRDHAGAATAMHHHFDGVRSRIVAAIAQI